VRRRRIRIQKNLMGVKGKTGEGRRLGKKPGEENDVEGDRKMCHGGVVKAGGRREKGLPWKLKIWRKNLKGSVWFRKKGGGGQRVSAG